MSPSVSREPFRDLVEGRITAEEYVDHIRREVRRVRDESHPPKRRKRGPLARLAQLIRRGRNET